MRPKRKILLVDGDEVRASVWRMVFWAHAFAVTVAADAAQALGQVKLTDFELIVLAISTPEDFEGLPAKLGEISRSPRLMLAHLCLPPAAVVVERSMKGGFSPCEVLEVVKVMSARRRGPRKGFRRPKLPVNMKAFELVEQAIGGEAVKMAPMAVMGAEMLNPGSSASVKVVA